MSSNAINVMLEEKIRDRLERLARSQDTSVESLIRRAVVEYLTRQESQRRDRQADLERWEEFRRSGKSISKDELLDWLSEFS